MMNLLFKGQELDAQDPLQEFRNKFHIPLQKSGKEFTYLCGHSLGLQPKTTTQYIEQELRDWAYYGVEAHFKGKNPWVDYHEFLTDPLARLVGALPSEVIAMNSLTVNLHLMMVSFYRPTRERYKILIEGGSFPSDQYALTSQIQYHAGALGFAADDALLEFKAKPNQDTPTTAEIIETIEKRGSEIALVLIGNVNYLSGQAFDMKAITQAAHRQGCLVGFDLAHGIGNLELHLHDCNVDFAVWCSYKYLNAGPGAIAGAFIHERHSKNPTVPRFAGWWGHQKKERFQMGSQFKPMETAEGWQLSNPPIFQCAALRASLELFDQAGMTELRKKSMLMTQYFFDVLEPLLLKNLKVMTPVNPQDRGSMLTLRLENGGRNVLEVLMEKGFLCDFREPNILRVTATPLYNKFTDVFYFVEALNRVL